MAARFSNLVAELRRRGVFKSTIIYAVTAWVVVQVAVTVAPLLNLPGWTATFVLLIALLGFPLMLVLSWRYDVVPAAAPPAAAVAQPAAARQSIAVLPFLDMSPDANQTHFSDGIAEEILNVLARLPHLRVAARTSAFAFRGRNEDVRRIGEQLGVAHVLEGSVRVAGNRVRITAQLIDVSSGYHRWSERYDRELGDVFSIQDEIARSIVRALDLEIGGEQRPRAQAVTSDMEAYDYYLRGRAYFMQQTRDGVIKAAPMFRKAVERDPKFAAAYANAAETAELHYLYWDPDPQLLADARAYAERALELAPDLPQARVAHGAVLSLLKQYDAAAREFEKALELDPLSFDAHYQYGRSRWAAGDLDGAAVHMRRASELRPDDYNAITLLTTIYHGLGRFDEEAAALRESFDRLQRSLELKPDDPRALYKGAHVLAVMGQAERGLEWAQRALVIDPHDAGTLYNVACVYARLGRADQAIDTLEQAIANGFTHREWIVNDADFIDVRRHPRFADVVSRLR